MAAKTAKDIMSKPAITAATTDTVKDLRALLTRKKISGVPVLDADKKLVGIATEADVLDARASTKVEKVMKKPVVKVGPGDSVRKIAQLLAKKKIKRVPVVDGRTGKLVGVVSRYDVVKAMAG